jgi:DoxX-like family
VISVLASLVFLMSACMKLKGGPELAQGMAHLGLPESMVMPLAILEISCTVIYLIPPTSVLGAILLSGYIAIATSHSIPGICQTLQEKTERVDLVARRSSYR